MPSFAERLNYLWDTRLSPRGTPYTLREVHEGTGRKLSMSYLSLLRKGGVAAPSGDKLQVLADFFGVPVSYFTATQVPQELAASEIDEDLLRALRNPMVRELALRAERMGREEWELVLHMMHHAREIVDRIKAEPKKPGEQPKSEADTADEERQAEEHDE
jgi:transcriptional regulator with XRE-family HTH domain